MTDETACWLLLLKRPRVRNTVSRADTKPISAHFNVRGLLPMCAPTSKPAVESSGRLQLAGRSVPTRLGFPFTPKGCPCEFERVKPFDDGCTLLVSSWPLVRSRANPHFWWVHLTWLSVGLALTTNVSSKIAGVSDSGIAPQRGEFIWLIRK